MKKLMALLLAAMLLFPAMAMADAVTYRCTMSIDQDYYAQMLKQAVNTSFASMDEVDETVDIVTEVICGILDASAFTATVQDNGIHLAWEVQEQETVNVLVTWSDEAVLLSTSLLPDTVLELPLSYAIENLSAVDWDGIAADMAKVCEAWLYSRDIAFDVTGQYAGAAYEGADERVVIRFDDADVALLVDGLLLVLEDHESLEYVVDGRILQDAIDGLRRFNHQAAITNQYDYELIIAFDGEYLTNDFIGMSLNVYEGDREAWSVSLGVDDNGGFRLIAGFHVDGNTNYFALTQALEEHGNESSAATVFAVYQVNEGVSYAEAVADRTNALYCGENTMEGEVIGTSTHFRRVNELDTVYYTYGVEAMRMHTDMTEEYTAQPFRHEIMQTVNIDGLDNAVTYHLLGTPSEPRVHPENAQRVNVLQLVTDTALQEKMNQKLVEGATEFGIMLFKQLPADLLIEVMRFAQ